MSPCRQGPRKARKFILKISKKRFDSTMKWPDRMQLSSILQGGETMGLMPTNKAFWKTKSLAEMTPAEWESLCDGCAVCCLEKVEDSATGAIETLGVACENLDLMSCRCKIYADRLDITPTCLRISLPSLPRWLPPTCAYRRLAEGRPLEWWHPLVSGSPATVHQADISIQDKAVSAQFVHLDDLY